jgi:hypothetical protein
MAVELTRLTHKIAIQLHLVAESCNICISRSRRPVRKLLDTPSYEVSVSFKWRIVVKYHIHRNHKGFVFKVYKPCDVTGYPYSVGLYMGKVKLSLCFFKLSTTP